MKMVAYTYVDHQDEIGYPIDLVTANLSFCESIHFFGSDKKNTDLLEAVRDRHPLRDRISCHQIDRKINIPQDIASAQNACLSWLRANDPFDFAVGLQADIFLGDRAVNLIASLSTSGENRSKAIVLPVDHVRIYSVAHRTRFGCTLIGWDSKAQFVGDGAYPEPQKTIPEADKDRNPYCLDVGYYTPEMYFRHLCRNAKTWSSAEGRKLVGTYGRDRNEFIRECLRKVFMYERGGVPLTAIDQNLPEHVAIMNYFKCHDDFRQVLGIIRELRG